MGWFSYWKSCFHWSDTKDHNLLMYSHHLLSFLLVKSLGIYNPTVKNRDWEIKVFLKSLIGDYLPGSYYRATLWAIWHKQTLTKLTILKNWFTLVRALLIIITDTVDFHQCLCNFSPLQTKERMNVNLWRQEATGSELFAPSASVGHHTRIGTQEIEVRLWPHGTYFFKCPVL